MGGSRRRDARSSRSFSAAPNTSISRPTRSADGSRTNTPRSPSRRCTARSTALAELGVLEHVHMGHGPAVYHLTHERHVHLVCRGCGVVLELTDDALTDVAAEIERTTGFVIEPSHFAINGRCAACAATT
ncbi:MAG: transcriptional repressor [Microthrixaceae bacterium]